MNTETRLGLTTDGRYWSFYLPLNAGSSSEKLVQSVDLKTAKAVDAAGVLRRYLEREEVLSGRAEKAAAQDLEHFVLQRAIECGWKNLKEGPAEKLVEIIADAAKSAAVRVATKPVPVLNDAVRGFIRDGFTFSPRPRRGGGDGPKPPRRPRLEVEVSDPASIAWTYRDERRAEKNATDMYVAIIGQLYEDCGGTRFYVGLQKKIQGRTRLNIATSPAEAGTRVSQIRALPGDWYVNTKLPTEAKLRYLRCACDVAGLAFGSDLVVGTGATGTTPLPPPPPPPPSRVAWTYGGKRRGARSAAAMYVAIIEQFYEDYGRRRFYVRLQKEIRGTKRLNISPSQDNAGSPTDSLREVSGGWYLNVHLSNKDKLRFLKKACKVAGIRFGSELKVEI